MVTYLPRLQSAARPRGSPVATLSSRPARGGGAAHAIEVHTSRHEMWQKLRTEAEHGALFPRRLELVVPGGHMEATVLWIVCVFVLFFK